MQTFMTPIREPGFQPRQSLPIRSRVYVERANQKPLTREDDNKRMNQFLVLPIFNSTV